MSLAAAMATLADLEWLEREVLGKAARRPSILRDEGFVRAALGEARRIQREVGKTLRSREVRERLARSTRLDWRRIPMGDRERLTGELERLVRGLPSAFLPGVEVALVDGGRRVAAATRAAITRTRPTLRVTPSLSLPNQRAVDALASTGTLFVSREYERRGSRIRDRARGIVARGLARGKGRVEIAAALERAFDDVAVAAGYWETVAAVHVARARSFASVATYAEAGVEQYEVVAIRDTRTDDVCTQLDGCRFSVKLALEGFERLEGATSLAGVKRRAPFLRESPDGIVLPDGTTVRRIGGKTGRGSASVLQAAGVHAPPFHPRCRCSLVPAFD